MRIAFFTDTYLPNTDGVVRSILNLQRALESRGHEVFIFSPSPDGKERIEGKVHFFRSIEFKQYPDYRLAILRASPVKKELEEKGIDIVHNHGVALTARAASKTELPKISSFHTNIAETVHYIAKIRPLEQPLKGGIWRYLRGLYSKFDILTAPSLKIVRELDEKGIKAEFLPNGIELSAFKSRREPSRSPLLIHVGRVVKEKNIETVLEMVGHARRAYPNIRLKIIGKGPALDYYRKMAADMGVADISEFTGYVDDDLLREYYRTADALVFASNFDTQGLVVLESLASGTPVLALKGTSGEEIVRDMGTAFSDADSFVAALKRAMEMEDAREIINLEPYDIHSVTGRLEGYYRSLLK